MQDCVYRFQKGPNKKPTSRGRCDINLPLGLLSTVSAFILILPLCFSSLVLFWSKCASCILHVPSLSLVACPLHLFPHFWRLNSCIMYVVKGTWIRLFEPRYFFQAARPEIWMRCETSQATGSPHCLIFCGWKVFQWNCMGFYQWNSCEAFLHSECYLWGTFFLSHCMPKKSLLYPQVFWLLREKRSLYWPLLTRQNYCHFFMEFWSIHAFLDIYLTFWRVNI